MTQIDPPSGWKYGFPKDYDEKGPWPENLKEWCIAHGYPREVADSYGDYFLIRIIGDKSLSQLKRISEQNK